MLVYILYRYCKKNDIQVVDGTKIKDVNVDEKEIDKLIKMLKLPHEVRDYQRAFIHSIQKNRCLLLSPTLQ